ncbi:MAG: lysine biosynthesis protein LysW [Anaerolineae bacterium]|nr:lysine biosynthesis protein LysW [Anaerolineae bacterium]
MARTYCITCDAEIVIENPRLGAKITCPDCGDALEIVSTDPLDVDYPYDDWDDEWDEDWEDEE